MHDVLLMHGLQSLEKALHYQLNLQRFYLLAAGDPLRKQSSLHQLHDQVNGVCGLIYSFQLHDILMLEFSHHGDLPHQGLLPLLLPVDELFKECLHSILLLILVAAYQIYSCKISLPNLLDRTISVMKASLDEVFA